MNELDPAHKALAEIEAHERECRLRYESIEESLERGSKRFDKLENMIWGIESTAETIISRIRTNDMKNATQVGSRYACEGKVDRGI